MVEQFDLTLGNMPSMHVTLTALTGMWYFHLLRFNSSVQCTSGSIFRPLHGRYAAVPRGTLFERHRDINLSINDYSTSLLSYTEAVRQLWRLRTLESQQGQQLRTSDDLPVTANYVGHLLRV